MLISYPPSYKSTRQHTCPNVLVCWLATGLAICLRQHSVIKPVTIQNQFKHTPVQRFSTSPASTVQSWSLRWRPFHRNECQYICRTDSSCRFLRSWHYQMLHTVHPHQHCNVYTTQQHTSLQTITRSSAICRESAHLTWLYCTVQKAFQYETRMDHECDSTAVPSVE